MVPSEKLVREIEKRDPLLAEQFRSQENMPSHRPVWPKNHLTETRTASEKEARLLDEVTSF